MNGIDSLDSPIEVQRCVDTVTRMVGILREISTMLEEDASPLYYETVDLLARHEVFLDRVLVMDTRQDIAACLVEVRALGETMASLFARINEEVCK